MPIPAGTLATSFCVSAPSWKSETTTISLKPGSARSQGEAQSNRPLVATLAQELGRAHRGNVRDVDRLTPCRDRLELVGRHQLDERLVGDAIGTQERDARQQLNLSLSVLLARNHLDR